MLGVLVGGWCTVPFSPPSPPLRRTHACAGVCLCVCDCRMALSRLEKQSAAAAAAAAASSDGEESPERKDRERDRESSRSPSPTRASSVSSSSSMADIAVRAGLFGGANSNSISSTGQLRAPCVALSPLPLLVAFMWGGVLWVLTRAQCASV